MIYNNTDAYKIKYFRNPTNGKIPVLEYILGIDKKDRAKIAKYIEYLRGNKGILDEPYTKHVRDKIRELCVDFGKNRHRIFFFTFIGKNIVLLHAFLKRTAKTPESEITR